MAEDVFHELPHAFRVHPETGEELNPVRTGPILGGAHSRSSTRPVPAFVSEKNDRLGIAENEEPIPVEEMGWRLEVTASEEAGLIISSVFFDNVFFIFNMHIPWLAVGTPCEFKEQFFLDKKIAGPFLFVFENSFLIWARYGFGRFGTLDQAYYFFSDGVCYPLIQLTTPTAINFVPLYIDFDVINTNNTVFNFYPHLSGDKNFHLAVTDFSRMGGGATPEGKSYNIKIENRIPGLKASARVSFNPADHPVQYITRWLGYNLLLHPLLNLRGLEIVNSDIVYVYLMQDLSTGLFGPKIELDLARKS
ncbi:MAG TPA: hypothetical protein PLY18_09160 [Bacillota bacterium]|nr:hypothetical protein [Bacillota bacterium]